MSQPQDNIAENIAPRPPGEGRFTGENVTLEETQAIQKRQRERSKLMAIGLVALCVLFFLITIVKIGVWG
ncbi:hypothetical protein [Alterisphingorhabdus coralli]|uniref:Uncharacterized protein n=1 Tax=Alterisphingorhabdus coralli TaxID=3071408 RepID=A0AA97I1F7_9SPHN|nr:hypothetical protein [Parasphingorhabdus sp. SCSIO 66989]WOE76007.1 hypothetical protein RB602_04620 [Parasphingorhabdus sp. SCSIO 66989]